MLIAIIALCTLRRTRKISWDMAGETGLQLGSQEQEHHGWCPTLCYVQSAHCTKAALKVVAMFVHCVNMRQIPLEVKPTQNQHLCLDVLLCTFQPMAYVGPLCGTGCWSLDFRNFSPLCVCHVHGAQLFAPRKPKKRKKHLLVTAGIDQAVRCIAGWCYMVLLGNTNASQ